MFGIRMYKLIVLISFFCFGLNYMGSVAALTIEAHNFNIIGDISKTELLSVIQEGDLILDNVSFSSILLSNLDSDQSIKFISQLEKLSFIQPILSKPALVYPNPMSLKRGGSLGYMVNKDMDVGLYLYNMSGREVGHVVYPAGSPGAQGGVYHRQLISAELFYGMHIESGIYVYILLGDKQVLYRGKMVILP